MSPPFTTSWAARPTCRSMCRTRTASATYFRQNQPRTPGVYDVLFGGVIDGKLLPDGDYTWVIEATAEGGQTQAAQGKFDRA